MARILVLNGPNLNLLGSREPAVYGRATLDEIIATLTRLAEGKGCKLTAFQSNAEAGLIERIHAAKSEGIDAILFNPGAFTHTSIALRDALLSVALPFVEVHLSNVYARESFRHQSYLSDIAQGVVVGFGPLSYELGLEALMRRLVRS
jgi:3-dehydroquinate dehydratase II